MPSLTRTNDEWHTITGELPLTLGAQALIDKIDNATAGGYAQSDALNTLDLTDDEARFVFNAEDRRLYPGRYTSEQNTTRAHDIEDWRVLTRCLPRGDAGQALHRRIDAECEMTRRAGKHYLQLEVTPEERDLLDVAELGAEAPITHAIITDTKQRKWLNQVNAGAIQAHRIGRLRAALKDGPWTFAMGLPIDELLRVTLAAERQAGYDSGHSDGQEMMLKATEDKPDDEQDAKGEPEQPVVAKAVVEKWLQECRHEATAKADEKCEQRLGEARRMAFDEGRKMERARLQDKIENTRLDAYAEGHKEGYRAARWACEQGILLNSTEPAASNAGTAPDSPADDGYDAYTEARKQQDLDQDRDAANAVRRQYQLRTAGQITYGALVVAVFLIALAPAIAAAIDAIQAALQ